MRSHVLVTQEMTKKAVCIHPDDHLHHAFGIMRRTGFRHLPVVDTSGDLVGILSDRDILRCGLVRNEELVIGNHTVANVMTRGVHTCQAGDRLGDIAEIMVRQRIDALPVTDAAGHVLGIITSTDILLYVRRIEGVLDAGAVMEARVDHDE